MLFSHAELSSNEKIKVAQGYNLQNSGEIKDKTLLRMTEGYRSFH